MWETVALFDQPVERVRFGQIRRRDKRESVDVDEGQLVDESETVLPMGLGALCDLPDGRGVRKHRTVFNARKGPIGHPDEVTDESIEPATPSR